jgi:hypothetical protein
MEKGMTDVLYSDRFKNIDNPKKFARFVLLKHYKDRNVYLNCRYKRLNRKYSEYEHEIEYVTHVLDNWGMVKINNGIEVHIAYTKHEYENIKHEYEITKKGINALKWSSIQMFEPKFLSDNKKFILTWIIQIVTLFLALVK